MSKRSNAYPYTRINRTGSAVAGSLLAHALLLLLLSRELLLDPAPATPPPSPITVNFAPREATPTAPPAMPEAQPAEPAPVPEPAPPQPRKPRQTVRPTPRMPVAPEAPPPPAPEPTPAISQPVPPAPAKPVPEPSELDPSQFPDMAAYVNAMKERRRQAGDPGSLNEEAQARARPPSEEEVRMANLTRAKPGTSGVFQILGMEKRRASFAFRGWQYELSFSRREFYEVEIGPDGDLPRAVVRKMIEIIRRYYSGDFNWQSPRFDQVIVLSARPQDNEGLEDFLLQEFFSTQGIPAY